VETGVLIGLGNNKTIDSVQVCWNQEVQETRYKITANQTLTFEDALKLVSMRANAMQKACELNPSTMAAILNLDDGYVYLSLIVLDNEIPSSDGYEAKDYDMFEGRMVL